MPPEGAAWREAVFRTLTSKQFHPDVKYLVK